MAAHKVVAERLTITGDARLPLPQRLSHCLGSRLSWFRQCLTLSEACRCLRIHAGHFHPPEHLMFACAGSIGVITGKFSLGELYGKIGYAKQLISKGRRAPAARNS